MWNKNTSPTCFILFHTQGFLIYAATILLSCHLDLLLRKGERRNRKEYTHVILKSLILSSFGKLFVVPLVIWNPNDIFFNLATLFTYISNFQALSGRFTLFHNCKLLSFSLNECTLNLFSSCDNESTENTMFYWHFSKFGSRVQSIGFQLK